MMIRKMKNGDDFRRMKCDDYQRKKTCDGKTQSENGGENGENGDERSVGSHRDEKAYCMVVYIVEICMLVVFKYSID